MARLKHWRLWVPPVVALGMLAAFLPGRKPYFERQPSSSTQRRAVNTALSRLRQRVDLAEMRQKLLHQFSTRQRVEREGLTIEYIAPVARAQAEQWADGILRDAATSLQTTVPRGHVLMILGPWDSINQLQAGRKILTKGMIGAPEDPCLTIEESGSDRLEYLQTGRALVPLGTCSFILAFGAPGTAVRPLLRRDFPNSRWDRLGYFTAGHLTGAKFWLDRWEITPELAQCRHGDADGCGAMVMLDFSPPEVGWLMHTYGGEAFGRFWRYNGSLEEASRAAFGVSLAEIGRRRLDTQLGVNSNGARIGMEDAGVGAVSIAAFLCLALLTARRRRVA